MVEYLAKRRYVIMNTNMAAKELGVSAKNGAKVGQAAESSG